MATPRNARLTLRAMLVAAALAVVVATLAPAGGYLGDGGVAHAATNTLSSTDPADGAALEESPERITLVFAQPVGATNTVLATCGPSSTSRTAFSVGAPQVEGSTIVVEVPNPMPKGSCAIAWRISTPAGEVDASGAFEFTVTSGAPASTTASTSSTAPASTATTAPSADGTAATTADEPPRVGGFLGVGRLLATLGLAMVLGSLVLIARAWPEGVEYILTVRFLRSAWILALVGAALTVVCLTSEISGRSFGGSLSPTTWSDLKESGPGLAALVRLVATAGIGWVVLQPERTLDPNTQVAALAIPAVAVATLGFSRSGGDMVALGAVAGVAHALAMAIWLGGLVLLWRVVLAGPGEEDLVHAVRGFGRISTPALLVTVVTGAVQTYRLDSGTLFSTGHGGVLLLKAIVVGAMVFVGIATRQFVNQRLTHVDAMTPGMAGRLRRAVSVEVVGGVVVLALSAWLLALVPGNVDAGGGSTRKYDSVQRFQPSTEIAVTVSLNAVVGATPVLIEVDRPDSGLTGLTVRFDPPAGALVSSGLITVPLTGAGAAEYSSAGGISIPVPGTWTVVVTAVTATGTVSQQKNVAVADVSSTSVASSTSAAR